MFYIMGHQWCKRKRFFQTRRMGHQERINNPKNKF